MKWKTHIAIGLSYAAASGRFEMLPATMLAAGAVFPDIIDRSISFGIESVWQKVHRKISHWWLIYFALTLSCIFTGMQMPYYLFIGCMLHIYADSLTMSGVPFLNPFEAGYGLRKAKTGNISEYILVGIMVGFMFIARLLPVPIWMTLTAIFILSAILNHKEQNPMQHDKKQIALSELSKLWTKYNIDTDTNQNVTALDNTNFRNNLINEFYQANTRDVPETQLSIITEILNYLDEHGDISSVSTNIKDISPYNEPALRQNLSKVTLLQHSINTANEIISRNRKLNAFYKGDMLIAALAHDIGKIPSTDRMNIGEHPKASILFLNSINGFKELPKKTAIEEAILNHHSTGGGELAEKLRIANTEARKKEAATNNPNQVKNTILDEIDAGTLTETLRARINVANGIKFDAFSFSSVVYFKTDAFWKAVAKSIQISPDTNFENPEYRKTHLLEAVKILNKTGFIENDLLTPETFTQMFSITFKDGSTQKIYATPLKLKSFNNPAELENNQSGILSEITAVTPLYLEKVK